MAKPVWKGSILDTYNGNDKFGGREGDDAKGVNKAAGVDFLKQLYNGVESVDGFVTNLNPVDHSPTNFNMVDTKKKSINAPFEALDVNTGFTWDGVSGISPYNSKEGKKYTSVVQKK